MSNDEELIWVARARAGCETAFEVIYSRYERHLFSFIYRMMGDEDDAHDLTQLAFVKAWLALPRVNDDRLNLSAWLHRIAANCALDMLRRRQRLRWLPWEAPKHDHRLVTQPTLDPEGALLAREARTETQASVRAALALLSAQDQRVLTLREEDGLSCAEIGEAMGMGRSAVKSLLFRSRARFRLAYAAVGGEAA